MESYTIKKHEDGNVSLQHNNDKPVICTDEFVIDALVGMFNTAAVAANLDPEKVTSITLEFKDKIKE